MPAGERGGGGWEEDAGLQMCVMLYAQHCAGVQVCGGFIKVRMAAEAIFSSLLCGCFPWVFRVTAVLSHVSLSCNQHHGQQQTPQHLRAAAGIHLNPLPEAPFPFFYACKN